jgi:hypothetical protein
MIKEVNFRNPATWMPVAFFAGVFLIGLLMYDDYGVSCDEPLQHELGLATWDYLSGKNTNLLSNGNLYLNPFIGLLEVLPEKILQLKTESDIYLSRHLLNFIFCWVGFIFFYLLALRLLRDYRFALLSCLLFLLTPRPIAHCFYNSKDLPFLFLFVVNVYLLVAWIEAPSRSKIIWMVICSGMLVGTRVAGLLFPVVLVSAAIFSTMAGKFKWKEMKLLALYLLLFPVSVYIFFPTFWHNPVAEFLTAVAVMSRHPYDVTSFFLGETVHSLQTPWYYIPVWMGIIIPIGWWIFFFAGLITLAMSIIRERFAFPVYWVVILTWLLLPLLTAIILHSSTYDDGRHLFFIYPPFLLIVTAGFRELIQSGSGIFKRFRVYTAVLVFVVTVVYLSVFMVKYHPFQYAYFNAIGRHYATGYFEKDYWGLSYRQGLEYLVKYDKSDQLKIAWKVDPGEWNLIWLKEEDRKRIQAVRYEECEYYLTNFRSHAPQAASDEMIYEVKVQGTTILAVFKMHPPNAKVEPKP